jgi:hypothetical protein
MNYYSLFHTLERAELEQDVDSCAVVPQQTFLQLAASVSNTQMVRHCPGILTQGLLLPDSMKKAGKMLLRIIGIF